ncbi:MAG: iron ABC transporter permease [Acidobacteria bacterium]|nr:iron ABC transporter permease [Acidobacteriota bacterium]
MTRGRLLLLATIVGAAAVVALAPLAGPAPLGLRQIIDAIIHPSGADVVTVQIVRLRLARIALGFVTGASLAAAGAAFQTLLANPLATPYTLGIAAGGSFGAFLALAVPAMAALGVFGAVPVQAMLWAGLELALLWALTRRAQWGATGLILAGVTLNFLFAAGTVFLRLVADPFRLQAMDRWLMGGLETVGWGPAETAGALALPGLIVLLAMAPALDQLTYPDALAYGRGVPVGRVRVITLVAGAWVTAACVAQAGPIAFVGLLIPHGVRLLFGAGHRRVLPASIFAGGAFLVASDALARSLSILGRGAELPVGVVTALLGGPVFLILLTRAGRR